MIIASPQTTRKLRKHRVRGGMKADGSVNWSSPSGPLGPDWYDAYIGISPIPDDHPPSLKNPLKTKIPLAQDGWKKGDSKKARDQAMSDLVEIHKRLRRQIGKPEISRTALNPVYPTGVNGSGIVAYNPDQPRDAHGRFGSGNSTQLDPKQTSALQEYAKLLAPHSAMYALIAQHGKVFTELAPSKTTGTMKHCFMNAYQLATGDSKLTYVEGLATTESLHGLPIEHAWVQDKQGRVIDPTWQRSGTAYLGVAFKTAYIQKVALRSRVYGVLSHTNRPLLQGKDKDFLASISAMNLNGVAAEINKRISAMNPNHEPAGSPEGGQFAPGGSGPGPTKATTAKKLGWTVLKPDKDNPTSSVMYKHPQHGTIIEAPNGSYKHYDSSGKFVSQGSYKPAQGEGVKQYLPAVSNQASVSTGPPAGMPQSFIHPDTGEKYEYSPATGKYQNTEASPVFNELTPKEVSDKFSFTPGGLPYPSPKAVEDAKPAVPYDKVPKDAQGVLKTFGYSFQKYGQNSGMALYTGKGGQAIYIKPTGEFEHYPKGPGSDATGKTTGSTLGELAKVVTKEPPQATVSGPTTAPASNDKPYPDPDSHGKAPTEVVALLTGRSYTQAEKDVVDNYKSTSGGINAAALTFTSKGTPQEIDDRIKQLDNALAKGRVKQDTVLWRGLGGGYAQDVLAQMTPGSAFHSHFYQETTTDQYTAVNFAGSMKENNLVLKIHVQAGTPAIPTTALTSKHVGERGIIFSRTAYYKVNSLYTSNGKNYADVDLIHPGVTITSSADQLAKLGKAAKELGYTNDEFQTALTTVTDAGGRDVTPNKFRLLRIKLENQARKR